MIHSLLKMKKKEPNLLQVVITQIKALMNFLIQEDKIGFTEEIVEKEQFDSAKKICNCNTK